MCCFPTGNATERWLAQKQADQVHKQIESEVVEGKWGLRQTDDVPFSTLVTEYLEYAKSAKAESTYKIDKYRIEAHLLPYFGDISIKNITQQMIDDYKGHRVKKRYKQ